MTKLLTRIGAAVVASLLVLSPSAAFAQSADVSSGLWYFDRGNVQAAFDAGFTGQGVTVAVIDTQINTSIPTLQGAKVVVKEPSYCYDTAGQPLPATSTDFAKARHGTNVSAMIAGSGASATAAPGVKGVAPGAKVLYYTATIPTGVGSNFDCLNATGASGGADGVISAFDDAVASGADIISLSNGGTGTGASFDAVARAMARGVIVVNGLENVQGLGSDGKVDGGGINTLNGVVAVQAFDSSGEIQKTAPNDSLSTTARPNFSENVKVAAPGLGILNQGSPASWDDQVLQSGTSLATPIVAGFLAVAKSKYPKATNNQLLQAMIRTTGGEESEPQWGNDMGYGAISLTGMLKVDPTKYPDVNPLFDASDPNLKPSAEDVQKAKDALLGSTASPAATASSSPSQAVPSSPSVAAPGSAAPTGVASGTNSAPPTWMPWAIGGLGAVVLLGAGAIVLVLMKSRASKQRTTMNRGPYGT